MGKLNLYGDTLLKTTGHHGADISSQRMDDLDKENIKYVLEGNRLKGLDVGCGYGFHSFRLSLLNVEMHLIDILDSSDYFDGFNNTVKFNIPIQYKKVDVNELKPDDIPDNLDFVYSLRFIHYLPFAKAVNFLTIVSKKIKTDGMLFLSASGIDSELSENYPHKDVKLEERFSVLSASMSEKHNILEPVCLYSEKDMEHLLLLSDFTPVKIWKSDFGNIKAIAKK